GYGDRAVDGLAARPGACIVEQDLGGHVRVRRDRLADREKTGRKVGAFTHVLEYLAAVHERSETHPVHPLALPLSTARCIATPPRCHVVAAYAAKRLTTFRHASRSAMRTAGAEVGPPQRDVARCRRGSGSWIGQPKTDALFQPCQYRAHDFRRCELSRRRNQCGVVSIPLALYGGALTAIKKKVLDLAFDDRRFLLHNQHVFEALCERFEARRIQRPHQTDLQMTDSRESGVRSAQPAQCFLNVERSFAHTDDTERCVTCGLMYAVQRMVSAEQPHCFQALRHTFFDRRCEEFACA